jgi:hypothetical protein
MSDTNFCGTPYDQRIFQNESLCMLSKNFQKLSVKIWFLQPLPLLKPACSALSFAWSVVSSLFNMILQKTLLASESSAMSLQLSHALKSLF